jgi:hypothetical protein
MCGRGNLGGGGSVSFLQSLILEEFENPLLLALHSRSRISVAPGWSPMVRKSRLASARGPYESQKPDRARFSG